MKNYSEIITHSKNHSAISAEVIDNYLMYYAATKEGMEKEMKIKFDRYKHIHLGDLHERFINFFKAEYVVSRIFLKNGLIKKYLNHSAIKQMPANQYLFLKEQSLTPWKFSFAIIVKKPHPDFFEMEDVFTKETYLLYSPSMTKTLETSNPILWFCLVGFNGECWQSFGLLLSFRNFDVDDIFFFATELDATISNDQELIESVEKNPIPYFMMVVGSESPSIHNKGNVLVHCTASDVLDRFDLAPFKKKFTIAWNEDVFQLKLKKWEAFPHFAIAFYDENKKLFFRTATTQSGFDELTNSINKLGFRLDGEADVCVSFSMLSTISDVFKKEISINPYESMFSISNTEENEEDESALEGYNEFLKLAIPLINEREKPNLVAMAKQTGIDYDMAKKIWAFLKRTS
jgi:hypothetical protein